MCSRGTDAQGHPALRRELVYSHPPWTNKDCFCKRRNNNHYAAVNDEGYEQFILQALTHHSLIEKQDRKQTSTQWHVLQRELKTKEGARAFFQSENILLHDRSSVKDLNKKPERSTASEEENPTTALTTIDIVPRNATFNLTEHVLPTEAAIRAKGIRKAKEAVGKAEGKTFK